MSDRNNYKTDIGLTLHITHDAHGFAAYIPEIDLYTCADTEVELLDAIVDIVEEYWLQLQSEPELREREPMRQHYLYYINTVLPALRRLERPDFVRNIVETIALRLLPFDKEALYA